MTNDLIREKALANLRKDKPGIPQISLSLIENDRAQASPELISGIDRVFNEVEKQKGG